MFVVENVLAATGAVIAMVGTTPSVRVTVMTLVPAFAAASFAVTVITLTPISSATLATDQAVVPAAAPAPPRSLAQLTCVTPNASLAVPPSAMVAAAVLKVAAAVGVAIATTGAVPSDIVTVRLSDFVLPAASRAVTVMTLAPGFSVTAGTDQAVVPVAVPL